MTAAQPDPSPARRQPLRLAAEDYWGQSRQPLAGLVFVAPLLVAYEAGILLLGPRAIHNGAETWLRQLLELIGLGQYFLLPLLSVGVLLGWHHTTHHSWRFPRGLFWGMTVECMLLTVVLWRLAQLHGSLLRTADGPAPAGVTSLLADAVSYLGAGIYEELLFRLILLTLTTWALGRLGLARGRLPVAIVLCSLVFSAAHYVGTYGDALQWHSFVFRFSAGVFFSVLFVYRGFGIAAGAHAGYDILVGVIT